jgi:hypothetical protein
LTARTRSAQDARRSGFRFAFRGRNLRERRMIDAFKDVGITQLVGVITAIGALGTAAFSLVDAAKAFGGGPSNIGYGFIESVLDRYAATLDLALGKSADGKSIFQDVVRAHWMNGRPRGEQKAIIKSLIRLGMTRDTAPELAAGANLDEAALAEATTKLERGTALTDADLNLIGRLDASIEAHLDAAYDRADQLYRNASHFLAGLVSIGLAEFVAWVTKTDWRVGLLVGILAVPLAPIAKDLASSLQVAAAAMRATK